MQNSSISISPLSDEYHTIRQSAQERRSPQPQPEYEQLDLFDTGLPFKKKPQISSIKGSSPYHKNRYQVTLGDHILGSRLNIDEALHLAKRGVK